MAIDFPSAEWLAAYEKAINESENYKVAAKTWTHGAIGFIVSADPALGLKEDMAFVLDLHAGVCNKAWISTIDEAKSQPFCITANYLQWKAVITGRLDPIQGMMQGKLKLKGNLPIIVSAVKAAQELVKCTTTLDTHFLDE